jgi:hypothetical protein
MSPSKVLSSLLLAAISALPAVASAQFVVTGQAGSSTVADTLQVLPGGTLGSASTSANFGGQVSSRTFLYLSVSESSAVASDSLSLSAQWINQRMDVTSMGGTKPIPTGTTSGSLSFDLAADTLVRMESWDLGSVSAIGLFQVPASGPNVAVSLPGRHNVDYQTNVGPHYGSSILGDGNQWLSAGHYLMTVDISVFGNPSSNGTLRAGMTLTAAAVPEPASAAMMALGLSGILAVAIKRRRQA